MNATIVSETNKLLSACLGCSIAEIKPEKHLIIDLLADSVALMDIAMMIEEQFQFEFDEKMMEALDTVEDLYLLVARHSPLYQYEDAGQLY